MFETRPMYPVPWWLNGCHAPYCKCPPPAPAPCPGDEFVVRLLYVDADGNAVFCVKRKPQTCSGSCFNKYK